MMVFGAYMLVNIWQNNQSCNSSSLDPDNVTLCYTVRDPLDLAVFAAALTGACFGFLWWNASPAAIFMGDTGSLSLGGAVAGLAILTRTELLLVILGGLFVLETVSVMLQVTTFKVTKRLTGTGRRVFRIAPIHHHFEMLGWEQVTVTIRFWIITGICVAAGLGIFYAEWVSGIG
jgi:phospho-N-acetylmuramoyl-pentapeptide-transferase